jgi:glycosyltransferase involved in cell wall biosynthesis
MNIAVISYHHSESSFVLAKYLAKTNNVHYYFITNVLKKSIPGIGYLSEKKFKIGLNEIRLQENHPLFSYINDANIKLTVIAYPTLPPWLDLVNEWLTYYFLRKIKKQNFDIVNLVGQQDLLIIYYRILQKHKLIFTLHEVAKHYNGQKIESRLLNFLNEKQVPIIVHSEISYKRLMSEYAYDKEKVINIHFGLFETYKYFNNAHLPEAKDSILFYGFLQAYKGLEIFIKAIKYARQSFPNIKAVIAGSGSDPALEIIKNDKTFIIINKYLENDEITELNKQAKIIICPYTSASQSGMVTTTNVFNKSVIASDIDGFKEIIIDKVSGYLIEVNDYVEFGKCIINLFMDENIISNMQKNVKEFYETGSYNWDNIAAQTINFYQNS